MSYILFVLIPFLVAVGAFLDDDAASLQVELTAMKAEMTKLQQTVNSMQGQLSMPSLSIYKFFPLSQCLYLK